MKLQDKKNKLTKTPGSAPKGKLPSLSLHGNAVQVSVDERIADLARRYPAFQTALGSLLREGHKRIRDFPAPEQMRIMRMVYALKKAEGHL